MACKRRTRLKALCGVGFIMVLLGMIILAGCGKPVEDGGVNPADRVWSEIIPEKGATTSYGIPLSLENTQQFIDWYDSIELSAEGEKVKGTALDALAAVCCDEFSIRTC